MDKKIGEVFEYNGVKLITIEGNNCKGCFFNSNSTCAIDVDQEIFCGKYRRHDNKNVIFRKVEDMESRTVKLTLEKAKEFYKKGGELKELALSAFTEEELTKVELPKTWKEFCSNFPTKNDEYFICSNSNFEPISSSSTRQAYTDRNLLPSQEAAKAHLALMQLHQLRDCYRQGWKPDWNTETYCICKKYNNKNTNDIIIFLYKHYHSFLSFQEKSIAEEFLKNFRGLIEQAGDLI